MIRASASASHRLHKAHPPNRATVGLPAKYMKVFWISQQILRYDPARKQAGQQEKPSGGCGPPARFAGAMRRFCPLATTKQLEPRRVIITTVQEKSNILTASTAES